MPLEQLAASLGNGKDMEIRPSMTLKRMVWSKEITIAGLSLPPTTASSSGHLTVVESQPGDLEYSRMESELTEMVHPY